ncbi:DUF4956 domain-containing protein [Arthrobacter sp. ISL-69]|uniref:DUF4956 domain-containing protein n=1 Tax=Arthrobacter sp. ISL-69 TaxID=2819113 RepID=UPI0028896CC1|nr:DUF4956 domain-containing protein [Arthrobacter sp. ISL-69]
MTPLILIAADLAAISILTFALYLRRHRRRDLVVSYLGMNVGVMAVAAALSGSAAGVGLGLGLFGVLSIIRLRSTELAQHEVAYYFSALALGLIAGLGIDPVWLPLALMAMILLVMFVGDHSRVLPAYRHQTVILDRAIAVDEELYARLEEVVHGKVHSATVQELDLVNDKTVVDVRYAYVPAAFPAGPAALQIPSAGTPVMEPAALAPFPTAAARHAADPAADRPSVEFPADPAAAVPSSRAANPVHASAAAA